MVTKPTGKPVGRPTLYTPELGQRIAEMYAEGALLRDIVAQPWAPKTFFTLRQWEDRYPDFRARMETARAAHADALFDGLPSVADKERDPQRARVKVDVDKWRAGKLSKRYSDKTEITVENQVSIVAAIEAGKARLLPAGHQTCIDNQLTIDNETAISPSRPDTLSVASDGASEAAEAPALPDELDFMQ